MPIRSDRFRPAADQQAPLVEQLLDVCKRALAGEPVEEELRARRPDGAEVALRISTRAVNGVREGEEWLLRNDDSSTWWLARACHVDDALEIGPDAARYVGCEMAGLVSGLRCPPRMDR